MAKDPPILLTVVQLRSEPDAIAADWLDADTPSRRTVLSALRNYVQRHSAGPPARINLPSGHPHRSEYSYYSSSEFLYVTLTVTRDGDQDQVETDYATGPVRQAGGDGPPLPWSTFITALVSEIDERESKGE